MKKNLLGLFAVVLAIGFSAFSTRAVTDWFRYDGTVFNEANYELPSNYTDIGTTAPSSGGLNVKLQAIKIDPATEKYTVGMFAGKPKVDVVSSSLQNDIHNATGISDGTVNEIMDRVLLKP